MIIIFLISDWPHRHNLLIVLVPDPLVHIVQAHLVQDVQPFLLARAESFEYCELRILLGKSLPEQVGELTASSYILFLALTFKLLGLLNIESNG